MSYDYYCHRCHQGYNIGDLKREPASCPDCLGGLDPEGIQEWIMRSYQVGVNPLPFLREVYTEYNFKFVERGVATPDVPLPSPGATILVYKNGGMAVTENALNQKEE